MKVKKLTPGEISAAVKRIREKYDEYIYKYFKPKTLRGAFEERYLDALKRNVDISSFLLAEISAIEELIAKEEERVARNPFKRITPQRETKKGFADKIMEEHAKKIEKYDNIDIHPDANPEVCRLLGALNELDIKYWGPLTVVLRNTSYSMNSPGMINMESQLRYLGNLTDAGVPQRLERYLGLLRAFPRDYHAIDREEKEYILEVSFFLHDLKDVLDVVYENYQNVEIINLKDLETIMDFVDGIIEDFRLKELKRKK